MGLGDRLLECVQDAGLQAGVAVAGGRGRVQTGVRHHLVAKAVVTMATLVSGLWSYMVNRRVSCNAIYQKQVTQALQKWEKDDCLKYTTPIWQLHMAHKRRVGQFAETE